MSIPDVRRSRVEALRERWQEVERRQDWKSAYVETEDPWCACIDILNPDRSCRNV